jgi:hypothetical protein
MYIKDVTNRLLNQSGKLGKKTIFDWKWDLILAPSDRVKMSCQ